MKQVLIKWGCSEGEADEAMRPYDSRTRGSWLASKASLRKKQCTERNTRSMSWNSVGEQSWGRGVLVKEGKKWSSLWKEKLGFCRCRPSDRASLMDTETRATGSGQSILDIVGCIKSCQQRLYVKKKKKKEMEAKQKMIKNRISRSEDRQ